MKNDRLYTIPKRYKKAEIKLLQEDRYEIYDEMNNSIDNTIGLTLQELYDYKSNEYFIGLHRTSSDKEDFLTNGIIMRGQYPEFDTNIQIFNNFPFMLREIKYCESYKMSTRCFIVKVPKKDIRKEYINENTQPIYYKDNDGFVRLRPEFIAAFVSVKNRVIQNIELNNKNHNIYDKNTEFIYDDNVNDIINTRKIN